MALGAAPAMPRSLAPAGGSPVSTAGCRHRNQGHLVIGPARASCAAVHLAAAPAANIRSTAAIEGVCGQNVTSHAAQTQEGARSAEKREHPADGLRSRIPL